MVKNKKKKLINNIINETDTVINDMDTLNDTLINDMDTLNDTVIKDMDTLNDTVIKDMDTLNNKIPNNNYSETSDLDKKNDKTSETSTDFDTKLNQLDSFK